MDRYYWCTPSSTSISHFSFTHYASSECDKTKDLRKVTTPEADNLPPGCNSCQAFLQQGALSMAKRQEPFHLLHLASENLKT